MKVFLHICCAPCLIYIKKYFGEEGIEWKGLFFNPNIHPGEEYQKRLTCLEDFISNENMTVSVKGQSSLDIFIEKIGNNREHWKNSSTNSRCLACYEWRLDETAFHAKKEGYKYFSTTLLISPYQDHDNLKNIGDRIASKNDLIFFYKDFRPFFRDGKKLARKNNFYMQKYCGCFLSMPR